MIKQIHVNECDSTQDLLKEQLGLFINEEKLLVSCDQQLHGRGRGKNEWTSLPGSLCFSMIIKPNPVFSFTSLELAVLIANFFHGSKLGLKWSNDIWNAQKKKCCGILVQHFQNTMIAGVGLNLCSNHPDYGGVYDYHFEFDKKAWANEIASYVYENRYDKIEALRKDWEAHCWHMHQMVAIIEGNEVTEGLFLGLGNDGEAVIRTEVGDKHLYNGSLRLLNP